MNIVFSPLPYCITAQCALNFANLNGYAYIFEIEKVFFQHKSGFRLTSSEYACHLDFSDTFLMESCCSICVFGCPLLRYNVSAIIFWEYKEISAQFQLYYDEQLDSQIMGSCQLEMHILSTNWKR